MFNLVQKFYIYILNSILNIIGEFSEDTRHNINKISVFLLVLASFYGEAADLMKFTAATNLCIIQAILLCVIILMSVKEPLKIVEWNYKYTVCWYAFCIIVLFTAFLHILRPGFRPMVLVMLVIYPALFFVRSNRKDYRTLYDMVAKSTVIISVGFFVLCWMNNPMVSETVRYLGATGNPGSLGKVGVVAFTCGVYLLMNSEKVKWMYAVFCGMAVELIVSSGSRTAFITMVALMFVFTIMFVKEHIIEKIELKELFKKGIVIIAAVIISSQASHFMLINGYDLLHNGKSVTDCFKVSLVMTVEAAEDVQDIAPAASSASDGSLINERLSVEGKNLDTYLSGRMVIYKAVIEKLTLFGNDGKDRAIYKDEIVTHRSAHNTVLEFTHRSGIFAGICFFLIELMTALYVIKKVFSKKICAAQEYFMIFAIVGFGLMSLTDVIYNPAAGPSMLFYFLAMGPLFEKDVK